MQIKNNLFILLVWLFCQSFFAQELPPIQGFTPQMYGADSQNWAIAQSSDKYIYFANNKGLLEYNGARWQLYPSPNETILRSVATADNKIYTGCYMEFGYWLKNNFGGLEYTSLSKELESEMIVDEQIWKIIPQDGWIIFQSLDRIYLYNILNKNFKIIDSESAITKMFLVDDTIMFQKINDGIYKIENGIASLLTSHDLIKNEPVVNVFSLDDGYLIQTVSKGFYKLDGSILEEWVTDANKVLRSANIYNSIRLKDKSFALGTISNGVIYLNSDGEINYEINQISGLDNNTVLSVFEDMDQNLWLGLDNGINCINMTSPFKVFNDQNGNLGTVYASQLYKGNLYLGTNQGLFYKNHSVKEDFKFVEGTKGQVWNLSVFDDTLFCGHNTGTFVINGNEASLIASEPGTWDIRSIPNKPDQLLQGNFEGLNVLWKKDGQWQFKNKVDGFDSSCKFFEITEDQTIYVGHEYKGVYDLKINTDYTEISKVSEVPELSKGSNASLVKFNNDILFAYNEGIFKYHSASRKFLKDSLLSTVFSGDNYVSGKLVLDTSANRLWSFAKNNISYIDPGKLSATPEIKKIPIPISLRKGMTGYENIKPIGNDIYLLGTSNGYLILDLNAIKDIQFEVKINSIKAGRIGIVDTNVSLNEAPEFHSSDNNFEFSFSVPEYSKYYELEYQYQLEGRYDQWSSWSTKSNATFDNLPHGDYSFNVSARIGDKEINNIASYNFSVEKPWHLSNLMVAIYLCLLLLFSLFTHTMYRRYYKKQQKMLLEKSHQNIDLKQLENEQQRILFENEALNIDIESKNRELAISTMSLIKKNEFLNDIKTELNTLEANQKIKSVIKIIDNNLNNTDDWKFFEEAFNNADKDFLKKMKGLHPALTSNDLRLCAYLRLNLSSKEIAPLLNISSRSVEVKRYRLRKKMDLPHETSLTNYILEV